MYGNIDNAFTSESLTGATPEYNYAGALSFARRKYTKDLSEAELAITGIPFDTATTNRREPGLGPGGLGLHLQRYHGSGIGLGNSTRLKS